MQKTFKNQQGREFLLLDLPSDAYEISLEDNTDYSYFSRMDETFSKPHKFYHSLPKGDYQILCLAKDATEEQAAMVVDSGDAYPNEARYKHGYRIYYDDNKEIDYYDGVTPKESLSCLLASLGFKKDDNLLILEKI